MTLFKSAFLPVGPNKLPNGSVKVPRSNTGQHQTISEAKKKGSFVPAQATNTHNRELSSALEGKNCYLHAPATLSQVPTKYNVVRGP